MDSEEKQRLADSVDCKKNYLSQISCGYRFAGRALIKRLCDADPRLHAEMFL